MNKLIVALFMCLVILSANQKEKIIIAGPFTNVSHPILHMIDTDALKDVAKRVEFKYWKNQDQLRAMILSNKVDFMAIPINVGANLYNKGVDLQLLNVSIWGNYGIVSSDKNIKSIKDLKGHTLAVPSRGDMPDIIMKKLLKANDMSIKDLKIIYMSTPINGLSMVVKGRVESAFLPEPALSMAVLKSKKKLNIVLNIQDEYKKAFKTTKTFPQVGFAVMGKIKNETKLIKRFLTEYKKSMKWYKNNPKQAGKIVVKYLPMLKEKAISMGIKNITIKTQTAQEAKDEIEVWFENLKIFNAKLIGGKLPNEEFYYNDYPSSL